MNNKQQEKLNIYNEIINYNKSLLNEMFSEPRYIIKYNDTYDYTKKEKIKIIDTYNLTNDNLTQYLFGIDFKKYSLNKFRQAVNQELLFFLLLVKSSSKKLDEVR